MHRERCMIKNTAIEGRGQFHLMFIFDSKGGRSVGCVESNVHKVRTMIIFCCLSVIGCGDAGQTAADNSINELEETVGAVSEDSAVDASPSESLQTLSGPQANAVRSAKQYLDMAGFSRDGLIQQLSSPAGDGYAESDATIAVDSLDVDWNENAAGSAKQYLSMTGFSCNGLIQQLSSSAGEKYTVEQATYGAQQAGAC